MTHTPEPTETAQNEPLRRRINRAAHSLAAREEMRLKAALLAADAQARKSGASYAQRCALVDSFVHERGGDAANHQ